MDLHIILLQMRMRTRHGDEPTVKVPSLPFLLTNPPASSLPVQSFVANCVTWGCDDSGNGASAGSITHAHQVEIIRESDNWIAVGDNRYPPPDCVGKC